MDRKALLVLEDGTVFHGIFIGIKGKTVGELIFNTAHVGYQEALTDPSYTAQLIVFTSPHIGNIGCNLQDEESEYFRAAGLILRERPTLPSYWRAQQSLQDYLEQHRVVGIAEIDTRALTRLLRVRGHLSACIIPEGDNVIEAKDSAANFREVKSATLLDRVSTTLPYLWKKTTTPTQDLHLVIYDFGVKQNILRLLEEGLESKITVVPATMSVHKVYDFEPDGIILSNGPGDPSAFTQIIEIVRTLVLTNIPILGICLGHQLLGLALNARIEKLKFGHHGINHPIKEMKTGHVFISSQNHNFAWVDEDLPKDIEVTHRSLFDFSIQGIQHKNKPIFGVQGHPEGCPGPTEISFIFEAFLQAVGQYYQWKKLGLKKCLNILV